jgi:hypothetical protein
MTLTRTPTFAVLLWIVLAGLASAQPATAPALRATDLHGTWSLDRAATIERAVAEAPANEKEQVRRELGAMLPDQAFTFAPDGKYTVKTDRRDGSTNTDAGSYTVTPGGVRMKSDDAGGTRELKLRLEGGALIINEMLVARKST